MAFGTKNRAETNGRHLQSNLSLEKYRELAEEFKSPQASQCLVSGMIMQNGRMKDEVSENTVFGHFSEFL
jgi:hypothetical protein